ncbi:MULTISPECIES: LacI family DNA-binding transcriptional regulator [Basfia]|uniref:PurR protein n=2 Tax=Basfia TaxID=697331 RepID=Q65T65_MANSM|nr:MULTISPECIES: LacI family DNA-binding transcriptional regulator [Basfia]AAU37845.1 PurR protein [[Mannheimia] succiniciproducens MBEL55E]QIM68580.1 trehalose operon repressor [Basfia succiniciproducens]SCX76640.1 transcriptional regulator, LacI family [Basfia succiniciproducens]
MKYTINEIAKLCNVGKSTVSRVLNKDPKVRSETREKVQRVIDRLGFQPNRSARAMRAGQEPVVGVIVSKLDSGSESQTLRAILQALQAEHITPLIVESRFEAEQVRHHFQLFRERQVNAVILFGFFPLPLEIVREWQGSLVVIARTYPNISSVYYDDEQAITRLMTELYRQGHRRIAYLGIQDSDETTGKLRTQSYLQFCRSHNIRPNSVSVELSAESAYLHCAELFTRPVDALVCATGRLALGAFKFSQQSGRVFPIAYVGYNELLQYMMPNALSLDFGYCQAGLKAVELLMRQLRGKSSTEHYLVSTHQP